MKRIIAVCMLMVLIVSQTACTFSRNNDRAVIPGSSITPAPGAAKEIKGDGENPTLTGVLTLRDADTGRMRFVDIKTGTEYEVPYTGSTDIQDAYGKIKAASTMDMGGIYDVYVDKKGKAVKIHGNSDAWVRYDVSGITVDENSRKLSIGASNMIYESYTVVLSGEERISIAQLVDQDKLVIRGVGEKVYSVNVPLDPENPEQFFGPKTVMQAPFAWEDWYGLMACGALIIPIGILLVYLIMRFFDNKPIIRKVKVEPKLPPHQLAMQEIERIKNEKVWQKGEPKEYYTELTDALRTYIKDRFGFNALEMTSSEIIEKLLEMQDKEAIADLRSLFETADLVKFAKHNPLMNENDANLINAIEFINETKEKEVENAKPQPTEITIIEKRSLRTKILLGIGIVVLSVALIGSFVYIGMQLYNYFA